MGLYVNPITAFILPVETCEPERLQSKPLRIDGTALGGGGRGRGMLYGLSISHQPNMAWITAPLSLFSLSFRVRELNVVQVRHEASSVKRCRWPQKTRDADPNMSCIDRHAGYSSCVRLVAACRSIVRV